MSRGKDEPIVELHQFIAAKVRARRKELGISIHKLRVAAGLSETTVLNIERGMRNTRVRSLYRVCKALDMGMGFINEFEEKEQ